MNDQLCGLGIRLPARSCASSASRCRPGIGLARLSGRHSGELLEFTTAELPGRQRTLHQLRSGTRAESARLRLLIRTAAGAEAADAVHPVWQVRHGM
ncbi:hypothetical protein [Nonomuraea sp. JJY05]|uniref:hypothetical protein n=1 Tax=Nonomuraea sp. JJY05 TaxID=3350255 RepID=UPI00373EE377